MGKVQQRTVLWYLVFIGFAVNYMIRINLNITIVEMVKQRPGAASHQRRISSECLIRASAGVNALESRNDSVQIVLCSNLHGTPCDGRNNTSTMESTLRPTTTIKKDKIFTFERSMLDIMKVNFTETGFDWNEYEQGLTLGSFFWLHWLTQIPGGILAKKYGTKLIFGMANIIGCWMCFFLPIASYWDYRALIFLRVVQGLICGLAWPAMHHMTGQWIPPNERSKFVTAYLGSSVGIAVFYPLFGYIISWSSWEWVFHFCGYIGTVWYIAWLFLVFDSPSKHPRISNEEKNYIEKSLGASVQHSNVGPTPWKEILTSKPVWMNVVAQWGGIWGLFTLMTQAPTYFKIIHGWDIKMTGLLSGLPHFTRMFFAYIFSMLGDYLLRSDKMSRTNVRKMATSMCCIVKGIFVFALAYSGCNSTLAVVLLTLATMVHGAVSTGPLASIVDIAPNHAGVVLGLSGMIGVLPGFISPVIVGILTLGNQTITSWKYVFLISAAMLFFSGVLYVLMCESTLQSWNNPKQIRDKEMQLFSAYHPSINDNTEKNADDEENENLVNKHIKS